MEFKTGEPIGTIQERVANGLAFLVEDERVDVNRVDPEILRISSAKACPLGQAWPVDDSGFYTATLVLGLSDEDTVLLGFYAANSSDEAEWDALQQEWKRVLTERAQAKA